jgi:hypothetical protein
MTLGAKILASLAFLCFLVWGLALLLGVQPLVPSGDVQIIYGEQESFHADGTAFSRIRNHSVFFVHLPHAAPDFRWWTVDFRNQTITEVRPPRSLGSWRFILKGDMAGRRINAAKNDEWLWRINERSASFTAKAFTCRVRWTGGT